MSLIAFSPLSPAIRDSLSDATLRGGDNSFLPSPNHFFRGGTEFDSGGALLAAVLRDDGTLLRPETMAMLFTPQLPPSVQTSFDASVYAPGAEILSHALPREARLTHALGGAVCQAREEEGGGAVLGGVGELLLGC